jgi:hypothetical protein
MSSNHTGDWMKLNCGDPVARKDNPCHTGRVIKIEHGSEVKVKWGGTCWYSATIKILGELNTDAVAASTKKIERDMREVGKYTWCRMVTASVLRAAEQQVGE